MIAVPTIGLPDDEFATVTAALDRSAGWEEKWPEPAGGGWLRPARLTFVG